MEAMVSPPSPCRDRARRRRIARPNLIGGAQREQCHPASTRLEQDDPLTPAERQTPYSDDTCLGHRRADYRQRLDRDRTVRVEVIQRVKIDGIDVAARHERFQIDHLRALDIERLQLLGGERDELAAIVFISLNDSRFLDRLARAWVMRA